MIFLIFTGSNLTDSKFTMFDTGFYGSDGEQVFSDAYSIFLQRMCGGYGVFLQKLNVVDGCYEEGEEERRINFCSKSIVFNAAIYDLFKPENLIPGTFIKINNFGVQSLELRGENKEKIYDRLIQENERIETGEFQEHVVFLDLNNSVRICKRSIVTAGSIEKEALAVNASRSLFDEVMRRMMINQYSSNGVITRFTMGCFGECYRVKTRNNEEVYRGIIEMLREKMSE